MDGLKNRLHGGIKDYADYADFLCCIRTRNSRADDLLPQTCRQRASFGGVAAWCENRVARGRGAAALDSRERGVRR